MNHNFLLKRSKMLNGCKNQVDLSQQNEELQALYTNLVQKEKHLDKLQAKHEITKQKLFDSTVEAIATHRLLESLIHTNQRIVFGVKEIERSDENHQKVESEIIKSRLLVFEQLQYMKQSIYNLQLELQALSQLKQIQTVPSSDSFFQKRLDTMTTKMDDQKLSQTTKQLGLAILAQKQEIGEANEFNFLKKSHYNAKSSIPLTDSGLDRQLKEQLQIINPSLYQSLYMGQ